MEKKKRRKLDMTHPQHKVLGESSTKRPLKLIAHTKSVIDNMVEKGIPLTVERVSLNAGCSKSFIYKNQEIRDYINNSKQKPTIGKRTYTDLEEANKRIKELEIENMILHDEKINFYTVAKQAEVSRAYLYNHDAFSMMIEIFSNLQKENETEDSLYEKFQQAEKCYIELQQKYEEVKTKYGSWCKEIM